MNVKLGVGDDFIIEIKKRDEEGELNKIEDDPI